MDLVKILLEYEDEDDFTLESVWAAPVGEHYQIENIPFHATSVAYGDIVRVEDREGELFFSNLVEASGHSVIQIIFFDKKDVHPVTQDLVNLGCDWEGSHIPTYIAVDVPPTVSYQTVRAYLDLKASGEILDFKEACLGFL